MNNTFYPPNDYRLYLEHHGIKGMRWGIRRWQDQNGRYNAAGRERYGIGDGREYTGVRTPTRQVRAPAAVRPAHRVPTPQPRQAIQNRVSSVAASAKAMADRVSNTSLSDAKKYVETYAFGKNTVDTYLKTNVTLSRIQSNDVFENFAFYATYKRHDVNAYTGLFGKNLMKRANAVARQAEKTAKKTGAEEDIQKAKELREKADNMKIYQLKIGLTKNLKVPSDENAGNVIGDLLKDSDFKNNVSRSIDHAKDIMRRPTQQALFKDAQSILKKNGALTNAERQTLYKAFNLTLTSHDDYEVAAQSKFYGELKKRGYSALVDINDKEYSSYHAHRPMIVFDTDSAKLQSVAQMSPRRVETLNKVYNVERVLKEIPANAVGVPTKYGETSYNIARRTVESIYNDYMGKGR